MVRCPVALEIQGTDRDGYHLVMSPQGVFTADSWHPTLRDAVAAAEELFDVSEDGWVRAS